MTRIAAISAAVALAVLLGGSLAYILLPRGADQFAQCRDGAVAGGLDSIGGPFELVNSAGETVTDADVITMPTILYFGYTFCPDVCPLDNLRNADAVDLLADQGVEAQPAFISVDPRRDTPEVVGEFAGYFHDRMVGLTGSEAQVKAASQAYKTYYNVHDTDDEFYLVDHSTYSYLVLPEYGTVAFFRRDASPEAVANQTACYVGAA